MSFRPAVLNGVRGSVPQTAPPFSMQPGGLPARHGEGNLSLRSVAAEAGYAPASVYEYFQNRAELVIALATDDLASLARELREKKEGDGSIKAAAAICAELSPQQRGSSRRRPGTAATAEPSEAERLFNGKLIAALTAFAEAGGIGACH